MIEAMSCKQAKAKIVWVLTWWKCEADVLPSSKMLSDGFISPSPLGTAL